MTPGTLGFMARASVGQLVWWVATGVLFALLGFRRGKGIAWRILGVIGVLSLLVTGGEIARRIGRKGV